MRRRSLRRNLAAASLLSLLVLWAVSVAGLLVQQRAATEQAIANDDHLASLAGELVSAYFRERFLNIKRLASIEGILTPGGLAQVERFGKDYPYYENIVILDAEGRVRASVPANPQVEGFDFSLNPAFLDAREGEVGLSEVYTSLATGDTIITGSIRAREAVIAADIDIGALSEAMGRIKPGRYSYLAILDRDGRYIYHPDLDYVITKRIDFRFNELFGKSRIEGIVRFEEEIDGRKSLVTATTVEATGWTVLVHHDLAGETRATALSLLASLVALALLVPGVFLLNYRNIRQVTRVLDGFAGQTGLIARGDYSVPLAEPAFEEFRPLAENFEAMRVGVTRREEALTERERALQAARDELASLNAALESRVAERTAELEVANASLRTANGELAATLRALTETQSKIAMSEKMTALGRIAACVAHELNTPLGIMASSLELVVRSLGRDLEDTADLLAGLGPEARALARRAAALVADADFAGRFPDPAEQRRRRGRAMASLGAAGHPDPFGCADSLVALGVPEFAEEAAPLLAGPEGPPLLAVLNGLLAPIQAARVATLAVSQASQVTGALRTYFVGTSNEEARPIRLLPQIKAILALFRDRLKRGIEVSLEVGEDVEVWGKPEEVGRIWLNLLSNAIYAVDRDGRVRVTAERRGDCLEVHVMDSGPGIPEKIRAHIFTPFFTTKPLGEGSGLGLDTARRLARANGGEIGFTSGGGLTGFIVSLPARPSGTACGAGDSSDLDDDLHSG